MSKEDKLALVIKRAREALKEIESLKANKDRANPIDADKLKTAKAMGFERILEALRS